MCHGFQMRKACRIAQANWYGHCGPDSRQKWQVVTQFQQIGNCQGKQRLAIYGPSSFPEVDHLFAPIAGESIFVEEHSKTSPFMDRPGGSRLECQLRSVKVVRAVEIRSSHLDKQDVAAIAHRPRPYRFPGLMACSSHRYRATRGPLPRSLSASPDRHGASARRDDI
jgi:hypothetical protein